MWQKKQNRVKFIVFIVMISLVFTTITTYASNKALHNETNNWELTMDKPKTAKNSSESNDKADTFSVVLKNKNSLKEDIEVYSFTDNTVTSISSEFEELKPGELAVNFENFPIKKGSDNSHLLILWKDKDTKRIKKEEFMLNK